MSDHLYRLFCRRRARHLIQVLERNARWVKEAQEAPPLYAWTKWMSENTDSIYY